LVILQEARLSLNFPSAAKLDDKPYGYRSFKFREIDEYPSQKGSLLAPGWRITIRLSGLIPFRFPLIHGFRVDPVFAILAFFQFAALLTFLALFAAIGHSRPPHFSLKENSAAEGILLTPRAAG
jgi:hypothetical protein